MPTTIAPNKVVLTCTVTGKQVTWTNRKIIQAKIDKFGSLEAFQAQYKGKGAGHGEKSERPSRTESPVAEVSTEMGKSNDNETNGMVREHVIDGVTIVERVFINKDGTKCRVTAPKPAQSDRQATTRTHAGSKAEKALREAL